MKCVVELVGVNTDVLTLGELVGVCKDAQTNKDYDANLKACKKRIENCLKLEHDSVFEFLDYVFRIRCPIYVARQLMRHRNGVFLERSLRSCDPLPYESDGSELDEMFKEQYETALKRYAALVDNGTPKEKARCVLPLCSPTEFVWKISFRSLMNVFKQRLTKAAQEETRGIVLQMFKNARSGRVVFRDLDWLPEAWCKRVGRDFEQIKKNGYSDEKF